MTPHGDQQTTAARNAKPPDYLLRMEAVHDDRCRNPHPFRLSNVGLKSQLPGRTYGPQRLVQNQSFQLRISQEFNQSEVRSLQMLQSSMIFHASCARLPSTPPGRRTAWRLSRASRLTWDDKESWPAECCSLLEVDLQGIRYAC